MSNTEYINARDKLIPVAEKYADKKIGKPPPKIGAGKHNKAYEIWASKWNKCFLGKMNELARGLYAD